MTRSWTTGLWSFDIFLTCFFIFGVFGTGSSIILSWRLRRPNILRLIFEDIVYLPFYSLLFSSLPIHLGASMARFFVNAKPVWGATVKDSEDQTFYAALLDTLRAFGRMQLTLVLMMGAYLGATLYFGTGMFRSWGFMCFAMGHTASPILLNPKLVSMQVDAAAATAVGWFQDRASWGTNRLGVPVLSATAAGVPALSPCVQQQIRQQRAFAGAPLRAGHRATEGEALASDAGLLAAPTAAGCGEGSGELRAPRRATLLPGASAAVTSAPGCGGAADDQLEQPDSLRPALSPLPAAPSAVRACWQAHTEAGAALPPSSSPDHSPSDLDPSGSTSLTAIEGYSLPPSAEPPNGLSILLPEHAGGICEDLETPVESGQFGEAAEQALLVVAGSDSSPAISPAPSSVILMSPSGGGPLAQPLSPRPLASSPVAAAAPCARGLGPGSWTPVPPDPLLQTGSSRPRWRWVPAADLVAPAPLFVFSPAVGGSFGGDVA